MVLEKDLNNLKNNEVYFYKDGYFVKIAKPETGFGKLTIHWENDEPKRINIDTSTLFEFKIE